MIDSCVARPKCVSVCVCLCVFVWFVRFRIETNDATRPWLRWIEVKSIPLGPVTAAAAPQK